jgi:hypothetical protein
MDETPDGCARVGALLAELATGAITGYERADALRHVAGCLSCRRELAGLSRVADDLLLLAPLREPPAGFETAVMRRLDPPAAKSRPWRQRQRPWRTGLRLAAAAAALLVAVSAGAVMGAAMQSWRTAPQRPAPPAVAGARAGTVTTERGAVVGHVYLYPGAPPWVMVSITGAPESGDYAMTVVTGDGRSYQAGVCPVSGGTGTTGYPLPVALARIAAIELSRPGVRLTVHMG